MDSCVSNTNRFYKLLASVQGDTRRETQSLNVYANHNTLTAPQHAAHVFMFKISILSAGRDPHASTVEIPTLVFNGRIPNYIFRWSKSNWRLFKIHKFSGLSLLGMTSYTHFLSGFLLWRMVIVISFTLVCKKCTKITQSLTKLNNEI